MDEYIYSLEANAEPMTEKEWRDWIEKETADILKQNPEAKILNADDVISRLYDDGYIQD